MTVIAEDCVRRLTATVEDYVTVIAEFYLTVIVEGVAEMGLDKIVWQLPWHFCGVTASCMFPALQHWFHFPRERNQQDMTALPRDTPRDSFSLLFERSSSQS